jgi:hypothetical protein
VAHAITQIDGVGKGLDPDFDFISNSAPYIVEIEEGTNKYLKEEVIMYVINFQKKVTAFRRSMDHYAIERSNSKAAVTPIVLKREL